MQLFKEIFVDSSVQMVKTLFKKRSGIIRTLLFIQLIGYVNGILLPKLYWPTVRKNCSSDREKLMKFEAEGQEFSEFLRSLEQFIQTVKGQNNIW